MITKRRQSLAKISGSLDALSIIGLLLLYFLSSNLPLIIITNLLLIITLGFNLVVLIATFGAAESILPYVCSSGALLLGLGVSLHWKISIWLWIILLAGSLILAFKKPKPVYRVATKKQLLFLTGLSGVLCLAAGGTLWGNVHYTQQVQARTARMQKKPVAKTKSQHNANLVDAHRHKTQPQHPQGTKRIGRIVTLGQLDYVITRVQTVTERNSQVKTQPQTVIVVTYQVKNNSSTTVKPQPQITITDPQQHKLEPYDLPSLHKYQNRSVPSQNSIMLKTAFAATTTKGHFVYTFTDPHAHVPSQSVVADYL